MTPHRTVVYEGLVASDAAHNQSVRIFQGYEEAKLGALKFSKKMEERGLIFHSVSDALDALTGDVIEDVTADDVTWLSQPCALEPGWDVVN